MKKFYIFFCSFLFIFFISAFLLTFSQRIVFAQDSSFFSPNAVQLKVADSEAEPGDVIVKKKGELTRADRPYDSDIFGVVAVNPIITVGQSVPGSLPIITYGIALVKASADYEKINEGDYLTSSNVSGVARKAPYPGFVLGRAMESLEKGEDLIKVLVYPHEAVFEAKEAWQEMNIWEAIGRIISALERDVPNVLRYIFALLLASGSFIVGFRAFAVSLKEGITGISRNPLAKGSIRLSMMLNLIGIVVVTLAGLFIALFVILL